MTYLADDRLLLSARLSANAPTLAAQGNSVAVGLALSLLSAINDVGYMVQQSAGNISVSTAAGSALDALGANYGIPRNTGTAASAQVVFQVQVAPTVPISIPAGTVIATTGDGVSTQSIAYTTQAIATISAGATQSNAVAALANLAGTSGNAIIGAINTMITQITGVTTTNLVAVDGANSTVLGTDAQSDAQYRLSINAGILPKYSSAAILAAILAVPGVFDAYVVDPQDGTGNITYYWVQLDGTAPTIAGGSVVSGVITGATLTGVALAVDTAVRAVIPSGVTPKLGGAGSATSPFSVVNLTAIPIAYSAPASIQSSTIGPIIQAAVQAYVQSLLHNQALLPGPLFQYVQNFSGIGQALTNLNIGSSYTAIAATTPASTSASATQIYRATGSPTISLTRV